MEEKKVPSLIPSLAYIKSPREKRLEREMAQVAALLHDLATVVNKVSFFKPFAEGLFALHLQILRALQEGGD